MVGQTKGGRGGGVVGLGSQAAALGASDLFLCGFAEWRDKEIKR